MNDKSFNLLHEKWIVVMKPDGSTEEVSLLGLFSKAHLFLRLAGELPTQDIAVLRLLLAIMHAVFARYDCDGQWATILSPYDALERWKTLWDAGALSEDIIENYLLKYEDRFYLFHPERPFYQVAGMTGGTEFSAAKLNGQVSEGGHKTRLFPQRTGPGKSTLTYSEAARWLLHVNAFDDSAVKPHKRGIGLPRPGVGWLGKLGVIAAVGDNLFESLLLNLVLLKDGGDELWGAERPVWEAECVKSDERTEIVMPDNPCELLTLQSRRILLRREGDMVTGYIALSGDFFVDTNAYSEQMTLWRADRASRTRADQPRLHDPARQLWRDFSMMAGQSEGSRRPGVVEWLARLRGEGLIPRSHFRFQTASVTYDKNRGSITDVFGDSLSFSADLLADLGSSWVHRIIEEIDTTRLLVQQLGWFAHLVARAAGAKGNAEGRASSRGKTSSTANESKMAREQAYFELDRPFRSWLEAIDPKRNAMDQACDKWWEQARGIVRDLGGDIVARCGPHAFMGRHISERSKNGSTVERHYSASEAYQQFLNRTSSRQALRFVKKGGTGNGK